MKPTHQALCVAYVQRMLCNDTSPVYSTPGVDDKITEINELFQDILIYWDAPVYA